MAFKMSKPNPKGEKSPLPQDITDAVIDKTGTASKIAKAVKYGTQGSAIAKNPIIKNLASKSLGVASLMFDPVSMGTNDVVPFTEDDATNLYNKSCLLYTSPSPRDQA